MIFHKSTSNHTDQELLQLYAATGKSDYFGELFNRYIPLLYGVCLKYLQDEERAQDAVMQLFEELLPKVTSYEIKTFRTWLHSVVKNHCLQLLRKENREIRVDFNTDLMESDEVMHLLSDEEEANDRLKALQHCIEKLPQNQRVSVVYFFIKEMSYADITQKTGYPLKLVKSYIQNGKRNLSICIKKQVE